MVPDVGLTKICNLLKAGLYLAVGTNGTALQAGSTRLCAEVVRIPVQEASVTPYPAVEYFAYFTSTQIGGRTVREVGLFDAATGGNLIDRELVVPEQAVSSGQGLAVTLTLPVARPG